MAVLHLAAAFHGQIGNRLNRAISGRNRRECYLDQIVRTNRNIDILECIDKNSFLFRGNEWVMWSNISDYSHRPLDFVQKIETLKTFEDVCSAISKELSWFGFTCVTSFMMPGPGDSFKKGVHLNTRPQEYIDRYEEKNYVVRDPVVTELRNNVRPFSWGDIMKRRNISRAEMRIVEEASEFDVNDGLIVPIVTLSGTLSVFSPCGKNPDLSPNARRAVELISLYSHEAMKRKLLEHKREKEVHTPLTPREREVMHWVAAGKTDKEIAVILSIARGTVTLHVEHAKRKLDTFQRTFAIVKAIKYGEITI